MFDQREAESAFRRLSATAIETLPMAEAFLLLITFFETDPADGAKPDEEDGDMMLYQWGTYGRRSGLGPGFEINLTRQVIYPDRADQEIWQLGLTYGFEPSPTFAALKSGEEWCHSKEEALAFRQMILASPALIACQNSEPLRVQIGWQRC